MKENPAESRPAGNRRGAFFAVSDPISDTSNLLPVYLSIFHASPGMRFQPAIPAHSAAGGAQDRLRLRPASVRKSYGASRSPLGHSVMIHPCGSRPTEKIFVNLV